MRAFRVSFAVVTALALVASAAVAPAPLARAAETATAADNPAFKTGQRVVGEVITKLRSNHVDGSKYTPAQFRSGAIAGLIEAVRSHEFDLLEPAEKPALIKDLWALEVDGGAEIAPVFATLEKHFPGLGETDSWKLIDTLANGAIATTGDPFTRYFDQASMQKLMRMMMGGKPRSFGFRPAKGPDGLWRMNHVVAGFDAYVAGLEKGDVVLEINGRPVSSMTMKELSAIFGGEGEAADEKPVRFRIWRAGWSEPHEVDLRHREPEDSNVTWTMLEGGIGYIRLGNFLGQAATDVQRALEDLSEQGLRALIFDVRDNPGGAITTCTAITEKFLAPGKLIATTKTRGAGGGGGAMGMPAPRDQTFKSTGRSTQPRYPMAILINGSSASASEMFCGALKDHDRAVLVGQTTYGKGVGQGPVFLSTAFGRRFMMMTQLTYFNPDGATPQHVGVSPHLEVPVETTSPKISERIFVLRESGAIGDYVADELLASRIALARKLAVDDGGRADRWPGLAALAGDRADAGLLTALRGVVRDRLRKELIERGDEVADQLIVDRIDDGCLQTAATVVGESVASGSWPVPSGGGSPAPKPAPRAGKRGVLY